MSNSAAGNRYNFIWFVDTDGLPIGKTKIRPVAGGSTNGGPMRIDMPKSVNPTGAPPPDIVVSTGEDGYMQHRYQFPSDATTGIAIQMAAQDLVMAMRLSGMPTRALAGMTLGYEWLSKLQLPDVCGLFQSMAVRVSDGANVWSGVFYPRMTLRWNGRDQIAERTPGLFSYTATPQPSAYEPWGFSVLDENGDPVQAVGIPLQDSYHPMCMQALTGDNAIATFPLDYPPVDVASTAVILSSAIPTVRASVAATVLSVQGSSAPYGLTLSGNPGQDVRGVAVYGFRG